MSLPDSFKRGGGSARDMALIGAPQIFAFGFMFGVGHYLGYLVLKFFFQDVKYLANKEKRTPFKKSYLKKKEKSDSDQKTTTLHFQPNKDKF